MKARLLVVLLVVAIAVGIPATAGAYTIVGTKVSGVRNLRSTIYYSQSPSASWWVIDRVICSEASSGGTMSRKVTCKVYEMRRDSSTWTEYGYYSATSPTYNVSALSYSFYPRCSVPKYSEGWRMSYVKNVYYAAGVGLSTTVMMP